MKSALALLGAGVRANIVAGTRLAMFLKVSTLDFRISAGQFDQALRRSYSFTEAFGRARAAIAEREKGRGLVGSNPQMHVGPAMREKIESLAKRFEELDAAQPGIRAGL